jgi:GntR family transcriptional regulator / MocR family aminotransferase
VRHVGYGTLRSGLGTGPNHFENFGPLDLFFSIRPGSPKRAQIEQQLRDAIRSGRLRGGTRLAPTRTLASDLGVSRGVIVEAYAQLVAEGYLVTGPRSGTRVSERIEVLPTRGLATTPRAVAPVRYELRSGAPDPASFPRAAWLSATSEALRAMPDADLLGPHRGGLARLRASLADYLARSRAAAAMADQIVVTSGLANGLAAALEILRERGATRVAVEDPSWPHHARAVRLAGMEPIGVAVDESGLVVDSLERLGVDAVITTPAHQFPTGVVLSADRRARLLAWANSRAALIIEDDYDAEFRYDRHPVAALQGMAADRVIYAGTVSKTLSPVLRVGWLLLPRALADSVADWVHASGAWPSIIDQATLAVLIDRGALERHLRAMRRRYRGRRDALVDALTRSLDIDITGVAAGLHLVVRPRPGSDVRAIARQARERGVAIDTLHDRCWTHARSRPAMLLGYGALPEPAIAAAVAEIAGLPASAAMRRRPNPGSKGASVRSLTAR